MASMQDPIRQFAITNLFSVAQLGPYQLFFTNSAIFMFLTVGLIGAFLIGATANRQLVPGRAQSLAEISYQFVAATVRSTAGEEGMKFFPLVFSLFAFILVSNFLGLIPHAFTVMSHIVVTAALSLLVFLTVIVYGVYSHGWRWFRLFVTGYRLTFCRWWFSSVLSFLSRPISLSVRLFANMLAGPSR